MVPACWPGAEYYKQEKRWVMPTGATLTLRSLETPEDAAKLQGFSFSWIGWDELGQWRDDSAYKQIMATLRSAEPVEFKRIRATGNPGGPGMHWIRERFVDPAPLGYEIIKDQQTGMLRVFVPSRVTDNLILLKRDPGYIDRLRGVGSPELVRAWLEGDFSAVVGSFFTEFGPHHVRRPFKIPSGWLRFKAFDWGSARPACCLWFAVSDGEIAGIPVGALLVYREIYFAAGANVGLRLTVEQVADRIREAEVGDERMAYAVADPAIFATDGGPSIAERFAAKRVFFRPADNRRTGKLGASAGWDIIRQRLIGDDGLPMLYMFSTCTNLIRTLPLQQHDPAKPEDLDTAGEDHACDALRYGCASRPWVKQVPFRREHVSLELLWEMREKEYARF